MYHAVARSGLKAYGPRARVCECVSVHVYVCVSVSLSLSLRECVFIVYVRVCALFAEGGTTQSSQ